MSLEAIVDTAVDRFKQAMAQFAQHRDLTTLTPETAEAVAYGLRDALAEAGGAAYAHYLQAYDTFGDVVRDAHGEVCRFKKTSPHRVLTLFGPVRVQRRLYQNRADTKTHAPLDAAWGMQGEYLTPPVREAVLFACALGTPAETVQLLAKCAPFRPDASTVQREVVRTGRRIEAHREAIDRAVRAPEPVPEATRAAVVSADGATVLMRAPGVHFGRPGQRPDREAPAATPTAYRVAMVGAVSLYGAPEAPEGPPRRLQSRYVAHMPEPASPAFKACLEAEVDTLEERLAPGVARLLLLDGSRELWAYFEGDPRYADYHRCLDFWHAAEHLGGAAEALFGSGEPARRWYDKHRRLLKACDDGARRILRSIAYHAPRHERSATAAKHLEEQRTFFRRNGHRMPYATFRRNGWPIGSGPVEAACKTVVKSRLGRSGMRWTPEGGQHILDLRTYVKSDRWDAAWAQIKQLERVA